MTCDRVFEAFSSYTLKKPKLAYVRDEIFSLWKDKDFLYELRRMPPGRLKPVKRSTFRKKPYYFPAVKKRISP